MPKKEPLLDMARPYANIYSSGDAAERIPRFAQDGHYFSADRVYMSSDPGAPTLHEEPEAAEIDVDVDSAVTDEAEIALYLSDPRGEELMQMTRCDVSDMVRELNGPIVQGEGAHRMMAAWLVKHAS
jgi:hypothetical protein